MGHTLVIVGQKGFGVADIHRAIEQYCGGKWIRCTGYVPLPELVDLYTGADLFVYPSLYEGFGIPMLEAMACGTPVLASSVTSLPEVGGDAALYFDPRSQSDLSSALLRLIHNPELRDALAEKGAHRARRFSWEKTASQTVAIYRKLLGT